MKTIKHFLENRTISLPRIWITGVIIISCVFISSLSVRSQVSGKESPKGGALDKFAMATIAEADTPGINEADEKTENPIFYELDSDKPMELENWMTDDAYFGAYNRLFKIEKEPELKLEDWMLDESHFSLRVSMNDERKLKELDIQSTLVDFN